MTTLAVQTIPTLADIEIAEKRISPYIHRTPVMSSQSLNELTGAELFFKCENFQKIGAFKMRGASNAIFALSESEVRNGVATHSSGNHAQAVAYVARLRNVPAYIVMPENAPSVKKKAVERLGAKLYFCEPTIEAREAMLQGILEKTQANFMHPFNDYRIIAGQATCAKEFLVQVPDLEILTTPVGGGGLVSGTALLAHYLAPHIKVIGTEPALADDAAEGFRTGKIVPARKTLSIADGLRTSVGEKTFEIIRQYVHNILTAKEETIIEAMRLIWERMKIIIEPSCAVPLASILENTESFRGKKVGIILTGGNVDLENLPFGK